jgi:predicted Rossmann fold flavoprotein
LCVCFAMEKGGTIVIGGGGAGLLASWRAASVGADVLLLERNQRLGIKLLISGGGKCNITHLGSVDELRSAFREREARFLKPSLYRWTNDAMLRLLSSHGVPTVARPNGRVFPVSGQASDVVAALTRVLHEAGVRVRLGARVERVLRDEHGVSGVVVGTEVLPTRQLIVATGGVSYPRTGTTGDGYRWAEELGHRIVPLRPALAPIGVEPGLPPEWRGVAIRDCVLSVMIGQTRCASFRGDILFTHEGISGPAALEVSTAAAEAGGKGPAQLCVDFYPDLDFAELDERLNTMMLGQRSKMLGTVLNAELPNRLVPHLLTTAGVDASQRGHTLTREHRRAIARLLKEWRLGTVGLVNIERGEVTAGGVDLSEVDPQSMRSRKANGLYLCGEVLDIAGPVGGYNLQAAYSTGYVAGESAAEDARSGQA